MSAQSAFLAAARRARDAYAHVEAERLYKTALRLTAGPSGESVQVHNELGHEVLHPRGRIAEARRELGTALGEARLLGLDSSEAIWQFEQQLQIVRGIDNRKLEAEILRDLEDLRRLAQQPGAR